LSVARYDVYANPFAEDRSHTPFVLDVQNDHLGPMGSRVVIPLRTAKGFGAAARGLNPVFDVEGKAVVLDTASISSVQSALLKKTVSKAEAHRLEIADALDTLFGSY
jgi:toxin CcdB